MKTDQKKRELNSYARYSGMGFQMVAIILIGVFGGYKLDQFFHTKPFIIIILSILSVFFSIYSITRDLLKKR